MYGLNRKVKHRETISNNNGRNNNRNANQNRLPPIGNRPQGGRPPPSRFLHRIGPSSRSAYTDDDTITTLSTLHLRRPLGDDDDMESTALSTLVTATTATSVTTATSRKRHAKIGWDRFRIYEDRIILIFFCAGLLYFCNTILIKSGSGLNYGQSTHDDGLVSNHQARISAIAEEDYQARLVNAPKMGTIDTTALGQVPITTIETTSLGQVPITTTDTPGLGEVAKYRLSHGFNQGTIDTTASEQVPITTIDTTELGQVPIATIDTPGFNQMPVISQEDAAKLVANAEIHETNKEDGDDYSKSSTNELLSNHNIVMNKSTTTAATSNKREYGDLDDDDIIEETPEQFTSDNFVSGSAMEQQPPSYMELYESNGKHPYYTNDFAAKQPRDMTNTYAKEILERKCQLTVTILDPHIPTASKSASVWFTLESVALNLDRNETCVVIQTSYCGITQRDLDMYDGYHVNDNDDSLEARTRRTVSRIIWNSALPTFREWIEIGVVRVTFLNYEKYNLPSCEDFFNPSFAWMNVNYWVDEYIDGVDSDQVLMVQDDSVLCHTLNPHLWKGLALVGAVWSPSECKNFAFFWNKWTREPSEGIDQLLPANYESFCGNDIGPQGNGGLSLRSRLWHIRAIQLCPHTDLSGIDVDDTLTPCRVSDYVNEDGYFAIIFSGMKAPLPTAYEASLFSLERFYPQELPEEFVGPPPHNIKHDVVMSRWGNAPAKLQLYHNMLTKKYDYAAPEIMRRTIPIGFHKPWCCRGEEELLNQQVTEECPLYKYVYHAKLMESYAVNPKIMDMPLPIS